MARDTSSGVLIALLAILLAALLTGGPMIGWGMMGWGGMARGVMGWGMMGGTYLFNPLAAILTFLLCALVIAAIIFLVAWIVRGPTSGQQPKS
jgi:uncharacterized membrane protein